MSNSHKPHAERSFFARSIRVLALPIIVGWIVATVFFNVAAPQLEAVGTWTNHSLCMLPVFNG